VSLWGRVFAEMYESIMARSERAGLTAKRHGLLSSATGRVVEIGAGTGLNLAHYPERVAELVLTEPEEPMARHLEKRVARAHAATTIVRAASERLPFDDDSVDTVVSTLVLCTVPDPAATLGELRRVLRPQGRLLFLEHVRSQDPGLARWQDCLAPFWVRFGHGCHCNRDTLANIGAAGFDIGDVASDRLPAAPPIVRPLVLGSATA
jgi:ubiquinone/menaquinone biosynthesis C-methylase UbiE